MGYLEDEVKRLHTVLGDVEGRLKALEERQLGKPASKTAEELRMVLIGPPGAGEPDRTGSGFGMATDTRQARERKRPSSRRSSPAVIW